MSQSLEKIDLLKERAGISYKQAAELLEELDGNVVEALIHLEVTHKQQAEEYQKLASENINKTKSQTKGFLDQLSESRFILQNAKNKLIDVPLLIAILISVVTLPFSIFVLIGLFISGNQVVIKKSGKPLKMNQIIKIIETEEATCEEEVQEVKQHQVDGTESMREEK